MKRFRLSLFAVASLLCFGCDSDPSGISISPEICDASNNYCKGDLVCTDGECAPTDPNDCKDKCCNVCDGDGCVDCTTLPDENLECKNKCCSECNGVGCINCSGNNDDPASPKDCKNKCCDSCDGDGCIDCSQCKGRSCKDCPGAGCKADDCSGKCCSECSGDGCRECGSTMADACPPKGSVGKMNFIVNMGTCTSFGCSLANDYSISFIEGRCPDDYPECIESETRGVWGCIGDGPVVQEPTDTKKDDDSVSSDAFSCDGKTVDPASFDTCGATPDNCAGTSCSIFWDGRSCRKVDGVYDCRCPEGQIECAGRCVDPLTDSEHCGNSCTNCVSIHGANATCQNGACSIPRCNIGEHPVYINNVIDHCETNTVTACAPTVTRSNDSIRNCELTAGDNVTKSICSTEGKCLVVSCAEGFRRNPTNTGCESITCQANEFLKGNTCYRYVDTCPEGSHISEDRKECVPNTNTACAPTTGWPNDKKYPTYADYAVTCPSNMPVCQRTGKCGCQDGQVLNREGNACVPGVCLNYPGVSRATVQNGICKPLDCTSDYKLVNRGGYPLCSPICTCGCKCGSLMDGYQSGECSEQTTYSVQGACIAVECAKGYKDWHGICLPVNNCCGSACKNCQTDNKVCSSTGTSGVCQ